MVAEHMQSASSRGRRMRTAIYQAIVQYRCTTLLLFILALFTFRYAGVRNITREQSAVTSKIDWNCTNEGDCFRKTDKCHRTKVFPFRIGCPAVCPPSLSDVSGSSDDGKRYRLSIAWYFGQPNAYRNSSYPRVYDRGTNFQCPNSFVEHFGKTSRILSKQFQAKLTPSNTNVIFKPQQVMHLGLAYFCCLRHHQAVTTIGLIKQWVQQRDFDFEVKFERLECWHKYLNSVTNILQVDETSQVVIMRILRDLEHFLESHGIPIIVPRTEQMPFHVTVAGVRLGEPGGSDESEAPQDDISRWLPQIHSIVQELDESTYFRGSAWTEGKPIHVQHKPRFTTTAKVHTESIS